ncbi:alpha/beta fold hydrolase [Cohnella sp. REN36]|uniref:alpha/beta fold hydrolase n=1 Tax=Cohnella sp. REN36 TaxID=2887347 RepID=UPI001D14704E|nr:alpha/beta hydrolase [Cohnella sp. REN36]MCC3376070.1 alpha/beta hydrolase [Cohnella sp. REN36]
MKKDEILTLPSGRKIGYAVYGNEGGETILAMHGTPGARIGAAFAAMDKLASAPGHAACRIVAVERPGYGLSDPLPGRTLGHVTADLLRVADALGAERFAAFASSGGAPFALALAAEAPERVSRVAIAAGLGPVYAPEVLEATSQQEQALLLAAIATPDAIAAFAARAQADPASFVEQYRARLPAAEQSLLTAQAREFFAQMVAESTRSADGMIDDYRTFGRPWRIAFEELRVPIRFWHSEADASIPIAHAEYLAERIPGATLTRLQGLTHLMTSPAVVPDALDYLLATSCV